MLTLRRFGRVSAGSKDQRLGERRSMGQGLKARGHRA